MKRFAIILAVLLTACVASYISAAVGYLLGGPKYSARFVPSDAAYTVVVLEALRKGDVESAVRMLETQLDSQIVEHATFDPRTASWLELAARDRSASDKLMARVAAYREAHPSQAPAEIRDAMDVHLATFRP